MKLFFFFCVMFSLGHCMNENLNQDIQETQNAEDINDQEKRSDDLDDEIEIPDIDLENDELNERELDENANENEDEEENDEDEIEDVDKRDNDSLGEDEPLEEEIDEDEDVVERSEANDYKRSVTEDLKALYEKAKAEFEKNLTACGTEKKFEPMKACKTCWTDCKAANTSNACSPCRRTCRLDWKEVKANGCNANRRDIRKLQWLIRASKRGNLRGYIKNEKFKGRKHDSSRRGKHFGRL